MRFTPKSGVFWHSSRAAMQLWIIIKPDYAPLIIEPHEGPEMVVGELVASIE